MGGTNAKPGEYQEPDLPEGQLEVRLSVYKLSMTGMALVDSMSAGLAGAYHSGTVIAGEEWSYGGHDDERSTGCYRSTPETNDEYIFYKRIIMGRINGTREQVLRKARSLAMLPEWIGSRYDLIEHNCNHFSSDLCWHLMGKRIPDWVNETADHLAKQRRRKRAEQGALDVALQAYVAEHGSPNAKQQQQQQQQQPPRTPRNGTTAMMPHSSDGQHVNGGQQSVPGHRAFVDTFSTTFELSWARGRDQRRELLSACPEGEDPLVLSREVEKNALDAAAAAAVAAARAVAAAARAAAVERAEQPQAGLQAWDNAWARESGPLLRQWREAAVSGELPLAAPGEEGGEARAEQLGAALASASAAAKSAADDATAAAAAALAASQPATTECAVAADSESAATTS
mmetsp:Transcript_54283/g.108120  ORF Transcript_54283/g.108120 Transcript_54283/m.108120 type:complete len:400 (-) Transcript_54283:50-1249(-)